LKPYGGARSVESIMHFIDTTLGRQIVDEVSCNQLAGKFSIDNLILAYFGPSDHDLHDLWMQVGQKDKEIALYSVSDDLCHQKYSA
jgi:hypothetical protein